MSWRLPHGHDARRIPRPRLPRWLTLAGLVVAVLLNSGCVTTGPRQWIHNGFKVGPNYCRPPAPVAAEWIQANDPRVQNHRRQRRLVERLPGPHPRRPDRHGLPAEPEPPLAGTRVLQARAQQAIAVGNIFPQTQQAIGRTPGNLSPTSLSALQSLRQDPAAHSRTGSRLQPELGARFLGPTSAGSVESANASLDASVENYDAALVTLLADVATNYVQYRVAQQRIKIARDNVRTQEGPGPRRARSSEGRHRDLARRGTSSGRSWSRPARPSRRWRSRSGRPMTRSASCWAAAPRPGAGAGPRAGAGQPADAEDPGLGRGGHPGRPAAPSPRRPQRRAPGGGPECPDRRGRGRPVPQHLHRHHARPAGHRPVPRS